MPQAQEAAHGNPCESTRLVWRTKSGVTIGQTAWTTLPDRSGKLFEDDTVDRGDRWTDRDGKKHNQLALYKVVSDHLLWLRSGGGSGICADLARANLESFNLPGQFLANANLRGLLAGGDFTGANLSYADLTDSDLEAADFRSADLSYASLNGADLTFTWLYGAYLEGTDMGDANINSTGMIGADYEPAVQPPLDGIVHAKGLESLTYSSNPTALTELHKLLLEHGYSETAAMIAHALQTTKVDQLLGTSVDERMALRTAFRISDRLRLRLRAIEAGCKENVGNCALYLLETVGLELTCDYGLSPWRPLAIIAAIWFTFSGIYLLFLHPRCKSALYVVVQKKNGKGKVKRRIGIPSGSQGTGRLQRFRWRLSQCLRKLRTTMLFSAANILNLDIDLLRSFNPWLLIKRLFPREFELEASGWARTIGGIQTIFSLYLIGLWALLMTHSPFE